MKNFGAEIFVADLVGIVLLRELGPLMTAILVAGRSAAAFAAEIGTMKVNEEINALTTMGLDPVQFLVVIRVLARKRKQCQKPLCHVCHVDGTIQL